MSETTIRINTLLAELSAFFVTRYGMTPRDAAGLVMQSPVAERLREDKSELLDFSVEQLAAMII